jgi:hypothetical protein
VAADQRAPQSVSAPMRSTWLVGTTCLTVLPILAAVALAPASGSSPSVALVWLLFVGSSAHVGATAWFYTVPEVRTHVSRHRTRYLWVPGLLVLGSVVAVAMLPDDDVLRLLLAYFAWQFFHFQKQNLGLAALAARAEGVARLSSFERWSLTTAGLGGIAALVGHPRLLQIDQHSLVAARFSPTFAGLFILGATTFLGATATGIVALLRRPPHDRPTSFVVVYLVSLLFFLPVFCFHSPYAAVAGLTIAHGLQYLLLMGLISGISTDQAPARVGLLIFVNIALVLGLALNQASHLHGSTSFLGKSLFGAYLGVVMAHFVVDAGLWRLRDEFPRTFLTKRLPYLLAPQGRPRGLTD